MKIIKKEAEYKEGEYIEAKIGQEVILLEGYLLIREGSIGKIVGFGENENIDGRRIRVEFPLIEVGRVDGSTKPIDPNDRFLSTKPEHLKFYKE